MATAAIVPLEAMLHPGSAVRTRPTGAEQRVRLPPLAIGRHMLERMVLHEEPPGSSWREAEYCSANPFVATFENATVHGAAGILHTADGVVAESLWQTDERAGYTCAGNGITLHRSATTRRRSGRVLSLLGGNHGNIYHWTLECLGRLAAADAEALDGCRTVLVPAPTRAFHEPSLALILRALGRSLAVEFVRPGEAVRVEHLLVPWTMTGHHRPHPALHPFFARAMAAIRPDPDLPRRVYLDRRASSHRPLANEAALIEALAGRGFAPVRLEAMPLATQVELFAGAETIVAPHGAGLTHLLHAGPGCRVIELHMDEWTCWCFRRLAAICGVAYDCVLGRVAPGPRPDWVHGRRWSVSPTHVLAAVDAVS